MTGAGHHRLRTGAEPANRLYLTDIIARTEARLPKALRGELAAFVARHRDGGLFQAVAATRRFPHLVTLNCGMGRDSIAMLCLLAEGTLQMEGQTLSPVDVDAVVFSDTGEEWPFTYALIPRIRQLCASMGVPFYHLKKPPKHGPRGWADNLRAKGDRAPPVWMRGTDGWSIAEKAERGAYHTRLPIRDEYIRYATIAVTTNASCTTNHKVDPIHRWLNDLSSHTFGPGTRSWGAKVKAGKRQRHRVLLGIAADEAQRAIKPGRPWYEGPVYPLLDMGISKRDEVAILARHGLDVPELPIFKSGCKICPYQPIGWYWVLSEVYPAFFSEIVAYEAAALARNPKLWVVDGRPLREAVAAWRSRHPHATHEGVLRKSYLRCMAPATGKPMGPKAKPGEMA